MALIQIFEDKVKNEKHSWYLKLNIFLTFIAIVMTWILVPTQIFIKEAQGLSPDASKRDFCAMAMNQVIKKKLSKKIITDSLYSQVINDNYKNLYFDGEETVESVFSNDNACKILVKTKDGIRSFDFTLEAEGSFEFYYTITKIRENELYEKGA
jgi:hypothetical protein